MGNLTVDLLLRQAQALSVEERKQFLELLTRQASREQPRSSNADLVAALANKGIRITVPPHRTPEATARFRSWKPIHMPGGSLSDELIRDRR